LPVLVLGVPVEGVLHDLAVLGDDVTHDRCGDAEDRLGAIRHRDLDALLAPLSVGLPVDPPGADGHRPVRIVNLVDEVSGFELHRLTPLRELGGGLAVVDPQAVASVRRMAATSPKKGARMDETLGQSDECEMRAAAASRLTRPAPKVAM
jgi:hypothetical protein